MSNCVALRSFVFVLGFLAATLARAELRREPPVATPANASSRQALLVTGADGRHAADADAFRGLLRRLGFEVATLAAENRVDLGSGLRNYAGSIHSGAEVAIFVLGTTLAHDHNLFVTASAPSSEVVAKPALYAAEGVPLSDTLRLVAAAGARDVVVVIDACQAPDDACAHPEVIDGTSAIVAYRAARSAPSAVPLAGVASLRDDLLPLMREPGLSLIDLYGRLRGRLQGTDMQLGTTPSLSRNFVFLPTGFLARLPLRCNEVEQGLDDTTLRRRDLGALARDCANDTRTWDFSSHFADKLAVVREQASYLRAVAACNASDAADSYLATYPGGFYRDRVTAFRARCQDEQSKARDAVQELGPPRVAAQPEAPPAPRQTALIPRGGQDASFRCDIPLHEPVAILICADAELAAADYGLGLTYRTTVRGLEPRLRHAVVRDQVDWLQRRNATCGIPSSGDWSPDDLARFKPCLMAAIEQRVRALSVQ